MTTSSAASGWRRAPASIARTRHRGRAARLPQSPVRLRPMSRPRSMPLTPPRTRGGSGPPRSAQRSSTRSLTRSRRTSRCWPSPRATTTASRCARRSRLTFRSPWSILKLAEVIGDILPPGVLNIVNGPGAEIGKALATSKRISKIAFTGETVTGRLIMQYAAQNLIPSTTELGGKSPNIFFEDVMAADDAFFDKAIEGLVLYAFNKGEVCTCPSRALIQESIYDAFMERCLERIAAIRQGDPLDRETMIGAQVSTSQLEKIESYVQIGLDEGAELLIGGARNILGGELEDGYYYKPTGCKGDNAMRIFQEEIFGPVLAVTTFKNEAEALSIANDTLYGLGAGVWSRDMGRAYRMGRAIKAGRVWTNCYHLYPAHAAFGGYKVSGVGRENHKMMLDHYSQTKFLLVSYDKNAMGFF